MANLEETLSEPAEIDLALLELKKESFPSGLRYVDIVVSYFHSLNGQRTSRISVAQVAQDLKLDPSYIKKAFEKSAALHLVKKVGDGVYETDIVTRTAVKRRSHQVLSSILSSSTKSRYLIYNLPDAFTKMREYALRNVYGSGSASTGPTN